MDRKRVSRTNLFNSVAITGAVKPGFSSGDAIRIIREEVASQTFPADIPMNGQVFPGKKANRRFTDPAHFYTERGLCLFFTCCAI